MAETSPVWLIGGVRSPFGRFCGGLTELTQVDLGAHVVTETLAASSWSPDGLDEMFCGMAMIEGGQNVPARLVAAEAGLPNELATLTLDRACCSGLTAIGLAARGIRDGERASLCLGLDHLSRVPRLLHDTRSGRRRGDLVVEDLLMMRSPLAGTPIATYAGQVAVDRGVDREMQDEWALQSHHRYFAARDAGFFDNEVVAVETPTGIVEHDEQPRAGLSLERLAKLNTVYDSPTVTPGNAPGLNDGAAAAVIASDAAASQAGTTPLARLVAYEQMAGDATSAVYLPGLAIRRLLERSGLDVTDLDVIEINEAFAATAVVSIKTLADGDPGIETILRERTNVNGGAVAIGHPPGASGVRLALTAARELRQRGGRYAAIAICGGFGQTDAALIEAP